MERGGRVLRTVGSFPRGRAEFALGVFPDTQKILIYGGRPSDDFEDELNDINLLEIRETEVVICPSLLLICIDAIRKAGYDISRSDLPVELQEKIDEAPAIQLEWTKPKTNPALQLRIRSHGTYDEDDVQQSGMAGCFAGNHFWIYGGMKSSRRFFSFHLLNLWHLYDRSQTGGPGERHGISLYALDYDKGLMFGGAAGPAYLHQQMMSDLWVFVTKEGPYGDSEPTWHQVPLTSATPLMARSKYGGGIVDDRLFIVGGHGDRHNHEEAKEINTMGVLDIIDVTPLLAGISEEQPIPACKSQQVTLPEPLPPVGTSSTMVLLDGKLFSLAESQCWCLDLQADRLEWRQLAWRGWKIEPAEGSGITGYDRTIIIFGGKRGGMYLNHLHLIKVSKDYSWIEVFACIPSTD